MYLYQTIAEKINQLIKESKVDERLPDERTLAERFSVSRSTVRKAIFELKERGLLRVTQGDGIYVKKDGDLVQNVNAGFYSLTNDMKSIGKSISTCIIDIQKISVDGIKMLSDFKCSHVYKILRTRKVNGNKGIYELNYINAAKVPDLPSHLRNDVSLYDLLNKHYGIYFDEGHEVLSVVLGNELAEHILSLPEKSPLVKVERTVSVGNTQLEKSISYIKPEIFSWRYELKGKKPLF